MINQLKVIIDYSTINVTYSLQTPLRLTLIAQQRENDFKPHSVYCKQFILWMNLIR